MKTYFEHISIAHFVKSPMNENIMVDKCERTVALKIHLAKLVSGLKEFFILNDKLVMEKLLFERNEHFIKLINNHLASKTKNS